MRRQTLLLAALVWAAVGVVAAHGQQRLVRGPLPPGGEANAAKAGAAASDPAEPPMTVEVSYGNDREMILRNERFAARGGAVPARRGQKVEVASGARGTTLTLNTPGAWQGSAKLTFKDSAPPMRFTLKLARMPGVDLQSLSLSSGAVTLQVGQVTTSETT